MRRRTAQTAWAIVGYRGWINHGSLKYRRRDVIAAWVEEFRRYSSMARYADLTDAQFWRVIKRRQNIAIRRITLRVAR